MKPALLVALCLAACGRPTRADPRLAEKARIILESNCGTCHFGSYPTALPGALAVFDLSRADWFTTIQTSHHAGILERLSAEAPGSDVELVRNFLHAQAAP